MNQQAADSLHLDRLVRLMHDGTAGLHADPGLLSAVRKAGHDRRRRLTLAATVSVALAVGAVATVAAPADPDRLLAERGQVATAPFTRSLAGPDDDALRDASDYKTTWQRTIRDGTAVSGSTTTTRDSSFVETVEGQIAGQSGGELGKPLLRYGLLALTWQQVLDLPQDQDTLRARLAAASVDKPGELLATGTQLLGSAPLLQPTRLALVDVLAEASKVVIVDARDSLGRPGTRLSFSVASPGTYDLIVDAPSGRLLEEVDRRQGTAALTKTWRSWAVSLATDGG